MTQVYNSQLDAFDLYHKIQESSEKTPSILSGPALPALGHAVAGSAGAAISNVCTYPLALIVTRLQIQRQLRKNATSPHSEEYKSIRDAVRKIYFREGGLDGFYVGVVSDTSKTIADSFLFFLTYNFLRQSRIRSLSSTSKHLPVVDELSVGFLAGAFSKLLTTPIANIVTRKQTSSMISSRHPGKDVEHDSLRSIVSQIKTEKGLQGFWSGYSASLVLTMNPSLTFFFFEALKRTLLPRSQRQNPLPRVTFFLAAISKAMASTITYPFSLAKSRLQSSNHDQGESPSTVKLERTYIQRSAPANVFTMILRIAQNEGLSALYEGLEGEVMKGFFSHGITMIVKEAVHKLVIQLYYSILKLLKKYPKEQVVQNVSDLAESTKEKASRMAENAGQHVKQAAADAETRVGQISDDVGDLTQEVAGGVAGTLGERKQQAATMVKDGMKAVKEKSQDLARDANARPTKDDS